MLASQFFPSPQLVLAVLLVALSIICAQDSSDRNVAPRGQHERDCGLFIHHETVTRDNCSTTLSIASCGGRCSSKSFPKLFYSKSTANSEPKPFQQECKCCGILQSRIGYQDISLNCTHNNTVVPHKQFISIAMNCGCTQCKFANN